MGISLFIYLSITSLSPLFGFTHFNTLGKDILNFPVKENSPADMTESKILNDLY
jgi:hypothetical protein